MPKTVAIPDELECGKIMYYRIPKTKWFYSERDETKVNFSSVSIPYKGGGVGLGIMLYSSGNFDWPNWIPVGKDMEFALLWIQFANDLCRYRRKYGEWRLAEQIKVGHPFPVMETKAEALKRLLKK